MQQLTLVRPAVAVDGHRRPAAGTPASAPASTPAPPRAPRHRDQQPAARADRRGRARRPRRRRAQLGRVPRGVAAVAHRCPCGRPDVLRTEPRLPDGTPFPTTYYATCPRLTGAISTLETTGHDARDDRPARPGPGAGRGLRSGARGLPAPAGRARRGRPRSRASPPAACRPGSSACTCWSATRSPPARASTRSATRRSPRCGEWWAAGSCVPEPDEVADRRRGRTRRGRRSDAGRRGRLRHQLDPPARRRRRPARRPVARRRRAPDGGRAARTRRGPHRRHRPRGDGPHPRRWRGEYAGQCRELGRRAVRFVATSASRDAANADEFVAGVREAFAGSASRPRSSPATRRRRCRSAARPAACGRRHRRVRTSWSTSAAGRPSSSAGTATVEAGPVGRHRLRAA